MQIIDLRERNTAWAWAIDSELRTDRWGSPESISRCNGLSTAEIYENTFELIYRAFNPRPYEGARDPVVAIAIDRTSVALITLRDEDRPEVKAPILPLNRLG